MSSTCGVSELIFWINKSQDTTIYSTINFDYVLLTYTVSAKTNGKCVYFAEHTENVMPL